MSQPVSDKIWLSSYPPDVPHTVDPSRYAHLNAFYDQATERYAERVAFTCMGSSLSYREVGRHAAVVASWLAQRFAPDNRIAVMIPNCLAYPVLIQAVHQAGMTVVNVNPLLAARELRHVLTDSQAKALFIWNGSAHLLDAITPRCPDVQAVATVCISDFCSGLKKHLIPFVLKWVKRRIPAYRLAGYDAVSLRAIIEDAGTPTVATPTVTPETLAFLQYTGGTTGTPKGAMLTHGNMVTNILQCTAFMPPGIKHNEEPRLVITALPLYHIFALTANFYTMLGLGTRNVLVVNPRDLPAFIKTLVAFPPEIITGVNTLFHALATHPQINTVNFSRLLLALGGGMPVQRETAKKWKAVTGRCILEAYGLTEASPAVAINPHTLEDYNGSIGVPVPNTIVRIVGDNDTVLGVGEKGELVVEGPQVMAGYWNNVEATAAAFTEQGWLRTGDVGEMDANGFLYIHERIKDLVIVSGFKIYPSEVEQVIHTLSGVSECACIGIADPVTGEKLKAFVVLEKGSGVTREDVIAHCQSALTAYKVPKEVKFVASLPKSNVGKILRRALKDDTSPLG